MNWAHFLLQANIYLVVFYAFYKLLLDKETYFILNRIYLVAAGLLSFTLPFIKVSWFNEQTVVQPVYEGVDQLNQLMAAATTAPPESDYLSIGQIIALVYLAGLVFFTLRFFYQLLKVNQLLKYTTAGTAFSFFNRSVIDPGLPEVDTIQHHEDVHSRQYHSVDVLIIEILGILNWFNPITYYYKHSIKSIHEYLADEQAAKYIGNKEEYALLLVSTAFGVPVSSLTNSFFNQPLLKKRIFMLHQEKSTKTALLKYGLFVPLFGLALMLSSATIRENEKLKEVGEQIPIDKPLALVGVLSPLQDGWKDFYAHLNRTITYPVAPAGKTLNGSTNIRFTIKGGNVENIGIAGKPLGSGADAAVMQHILAYKHFETAKDGNYILTVAFKNNEKSTPKIDEVSLDGYTKLNPVTIIGGSRIYDFVSIDKQPTFPGGMDKFYAYLKESVKFPAEAKANNVNGKVFLSFIVETDGSLKHIKVDRRLGSGTDEEAVRVLEESPKWEPGIYEGRTVRVKYNIPISFNTSSSAKKDTTKVVVSKELTLITAEGGELNLKSRANREPLYYIDGIKASKTDMNALNPNSIESINVLKGESATAVYGDLGKDGAILIATKTKHLNETSITPKKEEQAKP